MSQIAPLCAEVQAQTDYRDLAVLLVAGGRSDLTFDKGLSWTYVTSTIGTFVLDLDAHDNRSSLVFGARRGLIDT
jgi:hypothetical protein